MKRLKLIILEDSKFDNIKLPVEWMTKTKTKQILL